MARKTKPESDYSKAEWNLTPRQLLIQKLNKLLYAAQVRQISDNRADEILKLLSHI